MQDNIFVVYCGQKLYFLFFPNALVELAQQDGLR